MKTETHINKNGTVRAVYPLFRAGTIGWVVGLVLLMGLSPVFSKQPSMAGAVMWGLNRWFIAFGIGLLVLFAYGILRRLPLKLGTTAFVAPVVVVGSLAWVCALIYPGAGFKSDLASLLPVGVAFYLFALIWMWMRRDTTEQTDFSKAVLPTMFGGFVILAAIAGPAFASNDFRYQNAFGFDVTKSAVIGGELVCDAVITVHKAGKYHFRAPRYAMDQVGDGLAEDYEELGAIAWGAAGEPGETATGDFPVVIKWRKWIPEGGLLDLCNYEDTVYLEVRKDDASGEFLFGLHDMHAP